MKDKKNKVTAMAMATTIAVTTMAPLPTTTVYAQELDKTQIEARVKEENKEKDTKAEAPEDENKGAVENNKETSNVEDEKTEESTSNKENNEEKVQEEEKDNAEETDKVENQDNKENTDENTKVEDQEKKEETEIKDSNEKNEALDNAENKSESEKIEKETLEKVEEVEDKDLSRVEENKESGEKERDGEVAIDATNFPDKEFRQYVSDNFDTNNDGVLSEDEINAVTRIDVYQEKNILNLKGIEHFRNLRYLDCDRTGITSLDISKNTALQTLNCSMTGITSLDVSHNIALEYLDCNSTEITSLDVSNNKALTTLYCNYTGIRSLDVSNNKALTTLYCSDTGITSLDVSQNTALKDLNCSGTEITSLDVSQNKALKWLNCSSTGIKSLDVSQNTALIDLECSDTPIINLDIGNNNNLRLSYDANKTKDLTLTSNSFNAKDKLECDVSKIGNIKGATLDTNTGIMTIESIDTPITYEYDCGTSSNGQAVLNVTLNLERGDREIEINDDLNKTYDGNSVTLTKSDCTIKEVTTYDDVSTVENGDVTFTYYKKNSAGAWEKVQEVREVGEYKVVANLDKVEYWNEAVGEKEFKISQATNEWKDELLIDGWTYGEASKEPIASSKFGDVEFTYSNSKDGEFSSTTPTEAGIWYVKAEVIGNDNYTGISDIKEFEIKKAVAPEVILPNNLSAIQNDLLSTIELPEGWTWVNPNEKVTVNNKEYKARLTVDDKNYDYSKVDGYNSKGHYVERTLTVSVSQGKNEWSVTPSIKGWTYGEKANAPIGSAEHGSVIFTYSNSETGKFESTVPTDAGTWYMKATVLETPEYAELSKVIEFEIAKAKPTYSIPQDIKATYGQTLKDIKLPEGFSWVDDTQSVGNAGANKFVATYTPSYTNNYEIVNNIEVTVEVTQATNNWTQELSIEGWTYGEAPKNPTASAQFGEVKFSYSNKKTRNYTEEVPTGAGTWYVKAEVIGNDNYAGISDIKE
ncbi:leucine-rich repeat domain-containing protein, partial [uncultured Clostridium sp.]|uniref:leucine-rich repeat domain-containing protein n=1 Tax=uncultured Clostridium sp. TaxID=59620 RepID=UPI00272B4450